MHCVAVLPYCVPGSTLVFVIILLYTDTRQSIVLCQRVNGINQRQFWGGGALGILQLKPLCKATLQHASYAS